MQIINLQSVYKSYKKQAVLNNVSYQFESGKCYLIIGNNGCGKSTLLKGILGIISFDSGIVSIKSKKIGYVPEKLYFPELVTVNEFLLNLALISNNYKISKQTIDDLLIEWGLDCKKHLKMHELSKGMLQKVLIIQALLDDNSIYIFDEALNGLDIEMQSKFFSLIKYLKELHKTILITTHYFDYYYPYCDKILRIENGSIYEKSC